MNGSVEMGATAGHNSLLLEYLEKKLVDFADDRVKMDIGFSKQRFLDHAAKLGNKYGFKFKKTRPSNKWWQGVNIDTRQKIAVCQPECTTIICHQFINPVKVAKYFRALHSVITDCEPEQISNIDEMVYTWMSRLRKLWLLFA